MTETMTDVRAVAEQEVASHVIALYQLAKFTSASFARKLHPDLHPLGYGVLRLVLAAEDGVRPGEVAASLGIDKSSVSRQVAFLRDVGLVKTRPDPLDGRASLLVVSERARAQIESFHNGSLAVYTRLFCDWETSEVETFAELLGRFVESADAVSAEERIQ